MVKLNLLAELPFLGQERGVDLFHHRVRQLQQQPPDTLLSAVSQQSTQQSARR